MNIKGFGTAAVLAATLTAPAFGQGTVANVYSPLATDFQGCVAGSTPPMYAPALYPYPDGSLGMITMGNCLGRCDAGMGDSLFRWKRATNGSWSVANGGLSPSQSTQTLNGQTVQAGALPGFKEPISQSPQSPNACTTTTQHVNPTGAFGNPSTIVIGNKVFMAYEKGNGDWWNGEIWWAVSSDWGATWSVYSSPILYGLNHRAHDADGGCPEGFAGISMTTSTDAGGTWVHIYGSYFHPDRERRAQDSGVSAVHYRFRYDANHPFGFSSTKQLYYNGGFINHSGKFVWGYEAGSPLAGDVKLEPTLTDAPWSPDGYFFTSSVTKDSSGIYYMLVDNWRNDGDPLHYVTSCDAVTWSGVKHIDTTAISSAYPGKVLVNNSFWWGTLSGITGMWGFPSLAEFCSANPYDGTRILPVRITFSAPQTCS